MEKHMKDGYKCERCGHKWIPQVENPIQCPRCHSPKWQIKRKRPVFIVGKK